MKIDLGWYEHKKKCGICKLDPRTFMYCDKGNQLELRFKRKGKAQQEEARKFGHTNVIGFVELY